MFTTLFARLSIYYSNFMPRRKSKKNENYLILFRHGTSRWNRTNRFTGWVDIPLSEEGIFECLISAKKLEGLRLDVAFTSELIRAQQSLFILLSEQDYTGVFMHKQNRNNYRFHHRFFRGDEIPIYASSKLNERYYGTLQGMNKDEARNKFSESQVSAWRRGWGERPPKGESLKDTHKRVIPYFKKEIMPHIKDRKNVIVSAHGNSLRAIIKHIEQISDDNIPHLNFPTGQLVIYTFEKGNFTRKDTIYSFDRPIDWAESSDHYIRDINIKL